MPVKLALPKGRLQKDTAALLENAGLGISDYQERSRSYRPRSMHFPQLFLKMFHEKDIAIQVAIGNYDLGICGLDWVEELLVKYPNDALVKLQDLGYGAGALYTAVSKFSEFSSLDELRRRINDTPLRVVTEYPNLGESIALKLRLRKFKVFPVWGAAEAYPPENADLAVVSETSENKVLEKDLLPLSTLLQAKVFLIANRYSLERKDMGQLLDILCRQDVSNRVEQGPASVVKGERRVASSEFKEATDSCVRFALPDGHQQAPTAEFLEQIGLGVRGYHGKTLNRRPSFGIDGVVAKVVRPQDMPLQVANGNFDLAITGQDWLRDHLSRFPTSPVRELLSLGFGGVCIVAVVGGNLPAQNLRELKGMMGKMRIHQIRVASEYTNIADKYARDNHLSPYKVIPTWGASEAFLPEDADLLIENTQTGTTLRQHRLKIIDTLFESSACLIGRAGPSGDPAKEEKIAYIIQALGGERLRSAAPR